MKLFLLFLLFALLSVCYGQTCYQPCVNGVCSQSYCVCNAGYSGPQCDVPVKDIFTMNPYYNYLMVPNEILAVAVESITEVDSNNNVLDTFPLFTGAPWTTVSPNYFSMRLRNNAYLYLNLTYFNANSFETTMNEVVPVYDGSIKYTLTITNWYFSDPLNSLNLNFRVTGAIYTYCAGLVKSTSTNTLETSIVNSDGFYFYVQKFNKAIVDSNMISAPAVYNGKSYRNNYEVLEYNINIPNFSLSATISAHAIAYTKSCQICSCPSS